MPIPLTTLSMRLLAAVAIAGLGAMLTACSDGTDKEAKKTDTTATEVAKSTAVEPVDTIKTAATSANVKLPTAESTVDVAKLMEPGALPDISIGNPDAKVTIVEYMSMTCPHCARFHNDIFEAIKTKYVDSGKVKFVLREFPLDNRAAAAIMLARCAPKEQYFPMVSALFKSQMTWATAEDGRAALLQMSKLAGFTQESFEACLTNQKLLDDVNAVRDKAAKEYGVDSTPTFFINGGRYTGEMSIEEMSALIDAAE
ncbi:DsbA family protein [Rhizobium sp. KVB221]|uniref:DsbA family protein n=1 Tax=Rhizobium setariae TaxID=2801340 RepID=A0A936YMD8_9HYPH|nr:DsbA family protein [Rhizobium setariae]MBL0370871.1 DsbA family protein [Rhizobium setariae]